METKHTIGEWKVVHEINVESNEGYVCSCGGQRGNMTPDKGMEMNKANAKLIASAPDLLEALQMILTVHRLDLVGAAKGKAEQAIKKATS